MEKKEYTKPEMDVVELKHEARLLDGSPDPGPDVEMGLSTVPKDDVA